MLNEVQLLGFVGRDPETRPLQTGGIVCRFSLATSERWKDKASGERKERTEWHQVVLFGALAEIAEKYVGKGSKLYVRGKMRTRKWDKDGVDHYSTEVHLTSFGSDMLVMLDKAESQRPDLPASDGRDEASRPAGSRAAGTARGGRDNLDDDIPF